MNRFFSRRVMLQAGVLSGLTSGVFAQNSVNYPTRPIKFVVPITPGGSNDVVARTVAQKLTEMWSPKVRPMATPGYWGPAIFL
jgi:tripartite-type tricarboxylate transporter receptor subunit TctC